MKRYWIYSNDRQTWSFDWDSVPDGPYELQATSCYLSHLWGEWRQGSSDTPVGDVETKETLRAAVRWAEGSDDE
jgi:hypothetical protein